MRSNLPYSQRLPQEGGKIVVTLQDAEQSIQRKALSYNEDEYYDYLSAFCKSLRGSDSNAALYYAMRLIEGGCDPMTVARRLVIQFRRRRGNGRPQRNGCGNFRNVRA